MRANGCLFIGARTVLAIGLGMVLMSGTAWGQGQSPSHLFAQVLPKIRARTHIPILVPAWLPPDSSPRYPTATASAHEYDIDLADTPDCNGAMYCLGTTISGEDLTAIARYARGSSQSVPQYLRQNYFTGSRHVSLSDGIQGYYSAPGPVTADGGSTTLSWRYHGSYYQIQSRGTVSLAQMAHCAASALP